ncbi:MAG: hypothetical protein ACD_7C00437G0001 [uncultured bacterium]|nr:MAG: hypothetical protein ACD_7C00437G0001 [uncultured bacterium]
MLQALNDACKKIGEIKEFCFSYKKLKKHAKTNKEPNIVMLDSF